jgi:hypothetical protein
MRLAAGFATYFHAIGEKNAKNYAPHPRAATAAPDLSPFLALGARPNPDVINFKKIRKPRRRIGFP